MTPREKAYILRIAAILETGEWGAGNLVQELARINPAWDERAVASAVAYVRASLNRIPYTTRQFDVAA